MRTRNIVVVEAVFLEPDARAEDPRRRKHGEYVVALRVLEGTHGAEDFDIQMRLSLDGIGASLRSEDGYTIDNQVMPGGPAGKDGRLKAKDKITGVGQETGEIEEVFEVRLTEVVRKIRGKAGTKVRLRVLTALSGETVVYELKRDKVAITESEAKGEIIETKDRLGRPGKIGVTFSIYLQTDSYCDYLFGRFSIA